MGREKHSLKHNHLGNVKGVSFIELMIGVVLVSVVMIVLYEMLTSQSRTYILQDDLAEMQQNLRVAVEKVSRDLTMAGFGKPRWSAINQADASAWYNAGSNYQSYNISADGSNNIIDMVGCIDAIVGHVSGNIAAGSTAITLQAGEGASFNTTTRSDINVGCVENAKIQVVTGDVLTVDIDPATGGNQGFQFGYGADTLVCAVKWITYSIVDNVLKMDEHRGDGRQPIAQNITGMTVSVSAGNLLTLTLTARTRNPDRTTGLYITSQVTNKIRLRN